MNIGCHIVCVWVTRGGGVVSENLVSLEMWTTDTVFDRFYEQTIILPIII